MLLDEDIAIADERIVPTDEEADPTPTLSRLTHAHTSVH